MENPNIENRVIEILNDAYADWPTQIHQIKVIVTSFTSMLIHPIGSAAVVDTAIGNATVIARWHWAIAVGSPLESFLLQHARTHCRGINISLEVYPNYETPAEAILCQL